MSPLDNIPAEILLRILAFLPVQALRNVRLTSRGYDAFFREHKSTIYHHAALLHNFVGSIQTLLSEAKAAHQTLSFLQDAPDWYTYCRRYFQMKRNWIGVKDASVRFYGIPVHGVHRFKVDEEQGILITTHELGGLTVFDLNTAEVLWKLEMSYVRRHAHCEYDNGFLVFDRLGVAKEVWRLATLWPASESNASVPQASQPRDSQLQASAAAARDFAPAPGKPPKGHFRPWALIEAPEFGRAYRFVYPCLLVCGLRRAFVWNVVTARLEQQINNVQGNSHDGDINYVELSADHVFVCSASALRIFSRANGRILLEIPSYQLIYSDVRFAAQLDPAFARHQKAGPGEAVLLPLVPTYSTTLYTASYAEFSAVHVANDGKDLAAQLSDSRVYIIQDYMRVIRGEVSMHAAALEVGKTLPRFRSTDEHFSIYLAVGADHMGFITTSGVYLATPDPLKHGLLDEEFIDTGDLRVYDVPQSAIDEGLSFPYAMFASMPFYHERRQLAKVTCMQMTESRLYLVWDTMYKPENIDLFRRLGIIGNGNGLSADEHQRQQRQEDESLLADTNLSLDAAIRVRLRRWDFDIEDEDYPEGSQDGEMATETPGAGPSTATPAVEGEGWDWEAEEGGQEDSDDNSVGSHDDTDSSSSSDTHSNRNVPDVTHDPHSGKTGPIVFCIDFGPTGEC